MKAFRRIFLTKKLTVFDIPESYQLLSALATSSTSTTLTFLERDRTLATKTIKVHVLSEYTQPLPEDLGDFFASVKIPDFTPPFLVYTGFDTHTPAIGTHTNNIGRYTLSQHSGIPIFNLIFYQEVSRNTLETFKSSQSNLF
jgi:hypothetical protein